MARLSVVLTGVLLLAQLPACAGDLCSLQQPTGGSPVLEHFCQALAATNKADAAALRALMADDFAMTSVSGRYLGSSKEELINRWTEPSPPGTTSNSRLTKVFRTYQTATFGFVSGEIQDRTQSGSTTTCTLHAFTDIWELHELHWRWVQSHESGYRDTSCAD